MQRDLVRLYVVVDSARSHVQITGYSPRAAQCFDHLFGIHAVRLLERLNPRKLS